MGEAEPIPEASEKTFDVTCLKCDKDFKSPRDPKARQINERPICPDPGCKGRRTVLKGESPRGSERGEEKEEKEEKKERGGEAPEEATVPGLPANLEEEVKAIEGMFSIYGIPSKTQPIILHQWRVVQAMHDPPSFYNALIAMRIHPTTAQQFTQAVFSILHGQPGATGPVVLHLPGGGVQTAPPPYAGGYPYTPGAYPGYPAPPGAPPPAVAVTQADVQRAVKEAVENARAKWDRDQEMESLRGEIASLRQGAGRKQRRAHIPMLDENRRQIRDEEGHVVFQIVEEPLEDEDPTVRLVRTLKAEGLVGEGRQQPMDPNLKAVLDRMVALQEQVVKNQQPPKPLGPDEETRKLLDAERTKREDAEKKAIEDKHKADLKLADTERRYDAERAAAATDAKVREALDPVKAEMEKLREVNKPPSDAGVQRMKEQAVVFREGATTSLDSIERGQAILANGPLGQMLLGQQREGMYQRIVQFARANNLDPKDAVRHVFEGPAVPRTTSAQQDEAVKKLKEAAGQGA